MLRVSENPVSKQEWARSFLGKERRVLVLQESDLDRSLFDRLLEAKGLAFHYELEHCSDGAEARRLIRQQGYDVVLWDLGLSNRIDLQVLDQIQGIVACPVLVVSGLEDEALAREVMQHGVQEILSKSELSPAVLERTMSHSIERHRLMAELNKAKLKAEAASQAKSDFLAVMSHEFRTPMNGILGGINLLSNLCKDPQSTDLLTMMKQCAESQLNLIGDVLDISKIEAGGMELNYEAFSPRDLISSVLSTVSVRAREKGISLAVSIDSNLPRELVSDAMRLRQVLMNLVGNAVKFTNVGEVRIHARKLEGNLIEFRVTDTGIGISSKNVESIFETFTQVDSSYSRRYQGTGLGLAICKRLVKMLGGSIRVESQLGKGSDFQFTIASHEREARNSQLRELHGERSKRFAEAYPLSVLVVEDSPLVRSFLTATLLKLGYEAREAQCGKEALERIEAEHFDLIFMDICMPELDGFETADQLREKRKNDPEGPPYIAAITASVTADVRRRCEQMGIPTLLSKPIEVEDLRVALRAASSFAKKQRA